MNEIQVPALLALAEEALPDARRSPGAPYALFDADGTLWATDVANRLFTQLVAHRRLRASALVPLNEARVRSGLPPADDDPTAAYVSLFQAYNAGQVDEQFMFATMVRALCDFELPELAAEHTRALGPEAASPVAADLFPAMPTLFAGLRRLGYRLCVVSASPLWTVRFALAACGLVADEVRGAETQVEGERLTSRLVEPMTYREGKLTVARRDFGRDPTIAFGDGQGDVPFLAVSTVAVGINPRPALIRAAEGFLGRAVWLRCPVTQSGRPVEMPLVDESVED